MSEMAKVESIAEKSQAIGTFYDWLLAQGMILCQRDSEGEYQPVPTSIRPLLAQFFNIDLNKYEQERESALQELLRIQK